ncbi:capsule biosynthesis protein [Sphingomonas fennica]|uniref:capsular polysaccharide export protein, LipB/KpsS family n=1 Tax=Edaphosphingomonas fennica TaxID=114404 RepID=UPI001FE5AC46|nr:capsule biosynthesis protein [Sphingomonas fennica]
MPLAVPVVDRAAAPSHSDDMAQSCIEAVRAGRVGGCFWGAQPALAGRSLLLRPATVAQVRLMLARVKDMGLQHEAAIWLNGPMRAARSTIAADIPKIDDASDPWYLFDQADMLWCDAGDELALLARMAGRQVVCFGEGRFGALGTAQASGDLEDAVSTHLIAGFAYRNPFTGDDIPLVEAIELLAFWRRLIDANRPLRAAVGFAFWKRAAVAPLLWGGGDIPFVSDPAMLRRLPAGSAVALWRSKASPSLIEEMDRAGLVARDVEDGFIRSAGLGADCVPPLSIVVDALGAHFDPAGPTELENMLRAGGFPPALLERAARLRSRIVESGIGKYGAGGGALDRPGGERRHILVTGQVEDDRSVQCGGGDVGGNLDLLRRVRLHEPDAFILYKPHPDVEAGHRKGHVQDRDALAHADRVVRDVPISALLAMVDGVHVLTSLAGFEALLRGKAVTTHGVPFYAGWGLTTDLGIVPSRRGVPRTIDELVAAVLLLYPRYLDPVTRLPCPPEILVRHLAGNIDFGNPWIVGMRRLQGRVMRRWTEGRGTR